MKQVLTICKLKPSIEVAREIEATLKAFADACNYANEQVRPSMEQPNLPQVSPQMYK
ncbi:MAG: hypothetical protein N2235_20810 [Fischerella sp.]|nr:hypothetical protein [Fischerella sp.]